MGIPSAVVTLGGRGSMVIEGKEITPIDPFRPTSWTRPVPATPSWARCWRRSLQAPDSGRRHVRLGRLRLRDDLSGGAGLLRGHRRCRAAVG